MESHPPLGPPLSSSPDVSSHHHSMSSWRYAAEWRSINPSSIPAQLGPTLATLRWVA